MTTKIFKNPICDGQKQQEKVDDSGPWGPGAHPIKPRPRLQTFICMLLIIATSRATSSQALTSVSTQHKSSESSGTNTGRKGNAREAICWFLSQYFPNTDSTGAVKGCFGSAAIATRVLIAGRLEFIFVTFRYEFAAKMKTTKASGKTGSVEIRPCI